MRFEEGSYDIKLSVRETKGTLPSPHKLSLRLVGVASF